MMKKPRIKLSHQILVNDNNDYCFGEAGPNVYIIRNPPDYFKQLVTLLDGEHTHAEIVKHLTQQFSDLDASIFTGTIEKMQSMHLLEDADESSTQLTNEESELYDRQMLFFSLVESKNQPGFHYQEQLKNKHVVIFGLGSWGTWIAMNLCLSGIGELTLIDGDVVELSNLNRQVLYKYDDVGKLKVDAGKQTLLQMRPDIKINTVNKMINRDKKLIEQCIAGSDFVFLAWSNYAIFRDNTVEEVIHAVALEQSVAVMEAGADPINIYVGPIYPNQKDELSFFDIKTQVKEHWIHDGSKTSDFRSASMQNKLAVPSRELNSWHITPTLSTMSGIATSEALKFLGGYDVTELVGKRFELDFRSFKSSICDFFKLSVSTLASSKEAAKTP